MTFFVNPFPQHLDSNGDPLSAFVVYFGLPNQNPITNPKTIFSDIALTVPLSNPQTLTNQGRYVQDIFLEGSYSIRIESPAAVLFASTVSYTIDPSLSNEFAFTKDILQDAIDDADLILGNIVNTTGYDVAGDGGANQYVVVPGGTGTNDGGSFVNMANGLQLQALFSNRTVHAKQFNAPISPTNSTTELQNAINFAVSNNIEFVDLLPSEYLTTGLTNTNDIKFRGRGATSDNLAFRVLGQTNSRFNTPSQFSAMPFSSYTVDSIGTAAVDVDVEQLWLDNEIQGIVQYYVDNATGNDANAGTATNLPLKTINAAIQKVDVGRINLIGQDHFDGLDGFVPTRDVEIRSFSGQEVSIIMGEDPADITFTVVGGTSFEYEATIARTIFDVFDNTLPDGKGGFTAMILVGSSAAVNALPGSWFYDTGTTTLFVRMFTNRAPGVDLILLTASVNSIQGNQAIFLKNVKILGGNNSFEATATSGGTLVPRLYMKDVRIFYGVNFGIDSNGAQTFLQNVEIVSSALDNLNYHVEGVAQPLALEIDCISRDAGRGQVNESNNASSMHDGGVVVRINGVYSNSFGPNIPDTDDSFSLNVGTIVRNSIAPTAGFNTNFLSGQSGTGAALMFCHYVQSTESVTDYSAQETTISIFESNDQGVFVRVNATSFIKQYWPDDEI